MTKSFLLLDWKTSVKSFFQATELNIKTEIQTLKNGLDFYCDIQLHHLIIPIIIYFYYSSSF